HQDHTIRLWDVVTGAPGSLLADRWDWPVLAAFSPDGRILVTGDKDRTARLWDVRTGALLRAPLPQPAGVTALALTPDGTKFMVGDHDGMARLYEGSRAPAATTFAHGCSVGAITVSPDGRRLATAGGTRVRLWESATGRLLHSLEGHAPMG